MSSYRPEKVAEQIHKEVSQILMFNIKDPRVAGVNITAVKVARDIGSARIYFSVLDEANERKEAERGLRSAAPYIRRQLSQILRMRSVPELRFHYDESIGYGQKIDNLLRQVKVERDDSAADS